MLPNFLEVFMQKPSDNTLLSGQPLAVVNIGLDLFAETLAEQDVDVVHVQWSPPEERDEDLMNLLDALI